MMPDMRMIAVDLWAPIPGDRGPGTETYEAWQHEKYYENFRQKVAKDFPDRVMILRMHTLEAAERVPDGSLDFVFVDAGHDYSSALADIKAWTPKVRKGGMVIGHDYNWPSVRKAVEETGPVDFALTDNVWLRHV